MANEKLDETSVVEVRQQADRVHQFASMGTPVVLNVHNRNVAPQANGAFMQQAQAEGRIQHIPLGEGDNVTSVLNNPNATTAIQSRITTVQREMGESPNPATTLSADDAIPVVITLDSCTTDQLAELNMQAQSMRNSFGAIPVNITVVVSDVTAAEKLHVASNGSQVDVFSLNDANRSVSLGQEATTGARTEEKVVGNRMGVVETLKPMSSQSSAPSEERINTAA